MGKMVIICVKVDEEVLEKLDKYAEDRNITRSEAVRWAIDRLLIYDSMNAEASRIRVRRVVLKPPDPEPERSAQHNRWKHVRPSCEDIYEEKVAGTKSWHDIAKKYGFVSKDAVREWYRRNCSEFEGETVKNHNFFNL